MVGQTISHYKVTVKVGVGGMGVVYKADGQIVAEEFQKVEEELASAYAFYNLANALKSAFRFQKSKRYLKRAESLAVQHNDQRLLAVIAVLKKSIKARNRDIPNYVAGEQREFTQEN